MARSGRSSSNYSRNTLKNQDFSKTRSSAAAAASGYAKRHARKAARSTSRSEDVYEYAPEKVRRSKIALDLDREEEMDAGLGVPDGNDEVEDFRLKARLIGENEEDEKIDSEDDEEIDSDAAFDEDDDERFAGFFTKKVLKKKLSKKASVQFADVNLDEDDEHLELQKLEQDVSEAEVEEEESGEDDEFINVLDILDGKGEPLHDEDNDPSSASLRVKIPPDHASDEDMNSEEFGDQEDEEEDEDKEEGEDEAEEEDRTSISLSEAENEAAGALDDLHTFISSLDPSSSSSKKRKTDEEPEQPRKRRAVKERTEAGVESEFRTQSAGLSLNDLLAPLGQSSLEKSVKALQSSGGHTSSKKKKPQTLSVPLPQRTQERLDREAAYEQTKAEVDKWSATMKRISEAEHLSFPLQTQSQGKVSNLELAAKFKPSTALETTVSSLLTSANLATDASVLETEENILKTAAVSVEDVAERRQELRRMRELMFRAEVKAKRVKKIKSKVYRRLKRKEKGDVADDGDDGEEELSEERQLKMERERARERATLKHKNTGKWAKKMLNRTGYGEGDDDDNMRGGRQEIEEMLSRGEKLRRKIHGKGSDDDSQSGSEDDQEQDSGVEIESAFNELRALSKDDGADVVDSEGNKGKSVFEMKFMKDAMARKQAETIRTVDDFIKEIGEDDGHHSDSEAEFTQDNPDSGVVVSRTGGRIVLQPTARRSEHPGRTFSVASEETSSSTLKSTDFPTPTPLSPSEKTSRPVLSQPVSSELTSPGTPVNPWLVPSVNVPSRTARKKNEVVVDKDSSQTTKSRHKLKKQAKKTEEEKARAKDDALVEIEMDRVLTVSEAQQGQKKKVASEAILNNTKQNQSKKKKGKTHAPPSSGAVSDDDDSDSDNSEVEEQEKMLLTKGKKAKAVKAFEQRELVARAFAGDNVVRDFEEAKRREIAQDAPTEVDTTLPGWGSWGGTGVHKGAAKPYLIKKIAGIDPKSRADYNKSHVIISEKRDKKAAKYQVPDLPYPYTSKAQFDRRMQQPLGPEWNTRVGFQKGTLPKVVKKMSTVIDPLEKLS